MKRPGDKNAIERRIDVLREHYLAFTERPDPRLLCLCVSEDERPMVEAFVELESDERTGEIPDLFLRFEEPFEDPAAYGLALRAALIEQYEGSRGDLERDGVDIAWASPAMDARAWEGEAAGVSALIECSASFCEHYSDLLEHLVFVLLPARVSDAGAFKRWLAEAARRAAPTAIRFVVLDDLASPLLAALAVSDPAHVRAIAPNLGMPAAIEELSAAAGHLDSPGGMFRHLFVKLTGAAAKGEMAEAQGLAAQAIELAERSGFPHLAAVVHFAIGSALMARGRAPDAITRYQMADASAEQAGRAGDPSAPALQVNARLGAGAALLSAGAFERAAEVYEGAAALAEGAGDPLSQRFLMVECRRMAAYSHDRAGAIERAWAAGLEALRVGAQMSPEERAGSTLAYVGEGLLRMAGRSSSAAKDVDERMTSLLGPDWRPKLVAEERAP